MKRNHSWLSRRGAGAGSIAAAMFMFPLKSLIVAVAAVAFASCAGPAPRWVQVGVRDLSQKQIHEKCLFVLDRVELKIADSNVEEGRITSAWDQKLFPFYRPRGEGGGGFRRRAYVEIVEDPDATDDAKSRNVLTGREPARLVRVRVERERNEEKKRPADETLVKWEPDEDDVQLAARIAAMLQNQMSEFEPSDDFNRRFGGSSAGQAKPVPETKK